MRQATERLGFRTGGRGLHDITAELTAWVAVQGMSTGLLTVFLQHTSASLTIQENADPDVLRDLDDFLARLAPEDTSPTPPRARTTCRPTSAAC
jgi:secondary thiamine-phosphate synthase enzyme